MLASLLYVIWLDPGLFGYCAWTRLAKWDCAGVEKDIDLYTYVGNDPVDKADPSGVCDDPWCQSRADSQVTPQGVGAMMFSLADNLSIGGYSGVLPAGYSNDSSVQAGYRAGTLIADAITVGVVGAVTAANSTTTVTRYMGSAEAARAARTGEIPNVNPSGQPRPTHVTTDPPMTSASAAQKKYELPSQPTHAATVPGNRVRDLGPTPDGRQNTSGGGSQNATSQPIPVKPCEIRELCK